MPIQFHCTGCSHKLQVPDEAAGGQAKCPVCGTVMVVPDAQYSEVVPAEEVPSSESDTSQAGQPGADTPFGTAGGPPQGTIPAYNPYGRQPDSPFMPAINPRRFRIGEAWDDAWTIYTSRFWPIVGITLLVMVINGGVGMAEGAVRTVGFQLLGQAGYLVSIPANIVRQIFQAWLNIGLFLYLINMVTDRNPSINDLFSGGRYLLRYIGAAILFACGGLAILLIFALPVLGVYVADGNQFTQQGFENASQTFWIIGGPIASVGVLCLIFYALTFTLWPLLIIDRKARVIESLSVSAKLMRGNRLKYFLIQIVTTFAIMAIMILTCCIGFFFAAPFAGLLSVILYYHIAGLPIGRVYQEI